MMDELTTIFTKQEEFLENIDKWLKHFTSKMDLTYETSLQLFLKEKDEIDDYLSTPVDINNIDRELKMIPVIYDRVVELLPMYQYIKNSIKMLLDGTSAKLWLKCKENKLTDKTSEKVIEDEDIIKQIRSTYTKVNYVVDKLNSYEKKINLRMKSIDKIIKLYELGFFGNQ